MGIVIGLTGKRQSGKDTAANHLCNAAGFRRIAFADALRRKMSEQYGISVTLLSNPVFKETPCDQLGGRGPWDLLIEHGMKRRAEDRDYWVKPVVEAIEQSPHTSFAITDLRMPNEYEVLNRRDAVFVRMIRPALEERMAKAGVDDYVNERAQEQFLVDVDMRNVDGNLELLHRKLDTLLASLGDERARATALTPASSTL